MNIPALTQVCRALPAGLTSLALLAGQAQAVDFSINGPSFVAGDGSAVVASWSGNDAPTLDWIGLYRAGQTPGPNPSTRWSYATTEAGSWQAIANANNSWLGNWFVAYLNNDGYVPVPGTTQQPFTVTPPTGITVSPSLPQYGLGQDIEIGWGGNAGFVTSDWLGIYPAGAPVNNQYLTYEYAGAVAGTRTFAPLPVGSYDVYLLAADGYYQLGMASFSVIPEPATGALLVLGLGLLLARRRA